jgi:CRP/FNR family transcriptional regulator, dissimilatory nitrate respiration regulator
LAGLDQLTDEDREIVRRLPLFASLPPDALVKLLEGARVREYAKGDVLFRRDDPARNFYVVLAGWVKLYRLTEDGEEAVIHVFSRGDSVAEAAAFLGRAFPASAEIAEPARVLHIPTAVFLDELRSTPAIAINMLASMSRHLHQLVVEVEQLKTRSATRRVVEFLLRLCTIREGPQVIALPYDKNLISGRLGMKPESLSRILAKLREMGVRTEQNRIIISDVAVLVRYCEGEATADRVAAR